MEKIRFSFTIATDEVKAEKVANTISQILQRFSASGEEGVHSRLLSVSADVILPDGKTVSAGRAEMQQNINRVTMGL